MNTSEFQSPWDAFSFHLSGVSDALLDHPELELLLGSGLVREAQALCVAFRLRFPDASQAPAELSLPLPFP